MRVEYSERSVEDLKSFNPAERQFIAEKIQYLAENLAILKKSKKVTELKGTKFQGQYRFIIARKIRAIFRIENDELIVLVLRIGRRKNVYSLQTSNK